MLESVDNFVILEKGIWEVIEMVPRLYEQPGYKGRMF